MNEPPVKATIRIIKTPKGEAPLWVRGKWVGLELAAYTSRPMTCLSSGVLSGHPTSSLEKLWSALSGRYFVMTGFAVKSLDAIERLEKQYPEAAEWWRTHTPHLLDPTQWFLFDAAACEAIGR